MRISLFFLLSVILTSSLSAQQANDDVILKAMQDELNRNMKELKLPNYDKPFFIMYGITDQKTYSITSTLGSILQSSEHPLRFRSNTRILVGDYSFNDESLEDNLSSPGTALDISLPLDDDYFGIRRSLWSSTDKVYRDAARHFLKHQQTLKESGKSLADIPHRSFGKGKAITLLSDLRPYPLDKLTWEAKIKKLSAIFLKHPSILYSTVFFQFTEGHNYMVNSEGVVAKIPFQKTSIFVVGQQKNELGEFVMDQIVYNVQIPDDLPSVEQLQLEIENMIGGIAKQLNLPKLDEEYSGPVLLYGQAVAHAFSTALFNANESVIANNFIPRLTGYQYSNNAATMDNKIGKNILGDAITIKAKPKLKAYNDVPLLGAYDIDDEGMTPPDELTIVENGILKNLLNDRTITQKSQAANGFSSGAGVLEVTTTFHDSQNELKDKLISAAKAAGLDYALVVKQSPMLMGIVNVYKVYVKDGNEELVRNALLQDVTLKMVRRILGASGQYNAYNIGASKFLNPNNGQETSYIVPAAVVVGSMDIKPFEMPTLKEEDYVSNPLLGIK